jgi:hypothetical protein
LLNFAGWEQRTIFKGKVEGALKFERDGVTHICPLDHCPAEGVSFKHLQSNPTSQ